MYLNGQYLPAYSACMGVEERGTFFADGVYEVVRYFAGRPLGMAEHLQRLQRSLREIRLDPPADADHLDEISDELIRRNELTDATVYWQVTRGCAPRDAAFPKGVEPTVLAISYPAAPLDPDGQPAVLKAVLAEDLRWHRCDIKSLMLLANVLAKNEALDAGADEAILHRGDTVTEGTATSVCIVHQGQLWTHPADQWILDGITRRMLLKLAGQEGIETIERPFTVEQLFAADEVILCGTTKLVAAVASIDGRSIGDTTPGPVTDRLHAAMVAHIRQRCFATDPASRQG